MAKQKVCEGKTKAKFFIKFKDGKKEEVECSAPAFIELKDDVPNATGTEEYIVEGTYTSTIAGCTSKKWSTFLPGPGIRLKRQEDKIGDLIVVGYYVTNDAGFRAEISGEGASFQGFKESFEPQCDFYGASKAEGNGISIAVIKRKDDTEDEKKCLIIITDKDGKEVYRKSAECPIKWAVACGDEPCPPQHLQCRQSAYPGYRCVPCSEFRR